VGDGANGVALTRTGHAFVYSQFDHALTAIADVAGENPRLEGTLVVAGDTLPPDQASGRRLFYSAADPRMTSAAVGIACASCHLEGGEDGQAWHFLDGPRQTPALFGRKLDQTAPYHWSGVLPSMHAFMAMTITTRMGGTGLGPQDEASLVAFLLNAPVPDNPFRGVPLNASQQHGAQLFGSSGCGACHAGTAMTNDGFADVGTVSTDPSNPDDFSQMPTGLNVPSLLGVGRSAPYLHDGSQPTLKARILMNKDLNRHGMTSGLSDQDVDDLVAYLKTL
jgi:cytochrome c peroxidase